jgi:hypothetical protein
MKLTDQERDCKWLVWCDENNNLNQSFRYKRDAKKQHKEWQDKGYHAHIKDQYPGQY